MSRQLTGAQGEQVAAAFLTGKGYLLLACNYRTKKGELDLIAEKEDILVFVEVKTRKNLWYGTPAEAVTVSKRKKLELVALDYLQNTAKEYQEYRFDVIEIYLTETGSVKRINHIEDAFTCV